MSKPSVIKRVNPLVYGINFLVYADPGAGKTPLASSAPKTLILDADHGAESARDADVWTINSWHDMDEAWEYLRHEGHQEYEWVWLDGISVGQDRLLKGIMESLIAPTSQGGEGKSHRKLWQADKGEYGQNMFRLKQWVMNMTSSPFNFGITSHPWRYEDPVTEEERIMPWVQGKNMPETICGMMNVIGYMVVDDEGKQRLYTKPHGNYYARDKFGALGAGMINPTIPKIEAKIKEAVKATTKSATARKTAAPRRASARRATK